MVRRRGMLATATAAGLLPRTARSQAFPSKPLRFLVGAAPSGGVDTWQRYTLLTRALALPERCVAPSPSKA